MSTRRRRVKTSVPGSAIDWIRDADAAEICDALLAVDEAKAMEVLVRLVEKTGGEAEKILDAVGAEFDSDPLGTFFRGVGGAIAGLSRRRG